MKFVFLLALVAICVMLMHARPNVVKRSNEGPEDNSQLAQKEGLARQKRAATSSNVKKWPSTSICYRFENNYGTKKRKNVALQTIVQEAANDWNYMAGLKVHEKTSADNEADCILIHGGSGCWSWIGDQGATKNEIVLHENECFTKGVVLHELGHALGLIHEANREDRNAFIKINFPNVQPAMTSQFTQDHHSRDLTNTNTYDYCSIMQYSATAFSTNGNPTISITDNREEVMNSLPCLGSQMGLSLTDGESVAKLYGQHTEASDCGFGGYKLTTDSDTTCRCSNLFERNQAQCNKPKCKPTACDSTETLFELKTNEVQFRKTPGFGSSAGYPTDTLRTWVFHTTPDNFMCVRFPEGYQVEAPSTKGSCAFDWFEMALDEKLTIKTNRSCGSNTTAWHHVYPTNFLALTFSSDNQYTALGFEFGVAAIQADIASGTDATRMAACVAATNSWTPPTPQTAINTGTKDAYPYFYYYK